MIKLVALDLDGTLTQHKSKLDAKCREVLTRLSGAYKLVMVCAGGCERVYQQMDKFPIDIIGFYGMELSTAISGNLKIISKSKADSDKSEIAKMIGYLRDELGFTSYYGSGVEFHDSGIITFPLIGTDAPLNEKLAFDPDRSIRRRCYKHVCEAFSEYNVFVGGSSSFDFAPKPYCKLYALDEYLDKHSINKSEVIFFGDDYGFGGNDSDIYHSKIRFVTVDNYRDFPAIAKDVLL